MFVTTNYKEATHNLEAQAQSAIHGPQFTVWTPGSNRPNDRIHVYRYRNGGKAHQVASLPPGTTVAAAIHHAKVLYA